MKTLNAFVVLAGILKFGDAAITRWTTPVIATGSGPQTLSVSETQSTGETITTYVAVTDASTITYALGSAVSPFSLSSAGVLTITANLDAETETSYTLNIEATDDTATPATGTATITVTVTDVDEAPAFGQTSYSTCIAGGSTTGATLSTYLATDSDPGDAITHSIDAAGNTDMAFTIVPATGVVTVNTDTTLTTGTTYTLVLKAEDDETPKQTGSTTVSVEVTADGTCSGSTAIAVSIMAILMALIATIM